MSYLTRYALKLTLTICGLADFNEDCAVQKPRLDWRNCYGEGTTAWASFEYTLSSLLMFTAVVT